MNIELKIANNNDVQLTAYSPDDNNLFHLMDSNESIWMKVRLNSENKLEIIEKNERIVETPELLEAKLNKLVLDLIESRQSGTENTESKNLEEVTPYDPDKIKVHSKQFNVKLIAEMIDNEDIDFTPDFQRNFVWDSSQKSRLIESILLRIPLPMFYFAEDEEGRITVVDGLQRLTTIKEFMDNKFPLKGLQYLKDNCDNCYYSDKNKDGSPNGLKAIEAKYYRWFNMTQFSVNVIDPSSPPKVKYDIFRRINTGGKPLNDQEIRNCLAGKHVRELLKQMVGLPAFESATDKSIKGTRMDDHEVALRFILFKRLYDKDNSLDVYDGYMDTSLDNLVDELSLLKPEELKPYILLFANAMMNSEYLLGRKYAFRKITPKDLEPKAGKQLINKALFVSFSVLLSKFAHDDIKKNNVSDSLQLVLANEISSDPQFLKYLSYSTNSKANLKYVFNKVNQIITSNVRL